jgi:hypothetical protein
MSKGRGASSVKNRGNRIFIECLQKCSSASPFNEEKNRHRQEQKRHRQRLLLPGKARLICGMHFEMRLRQYTQKLTFEYEEDIKIKNKYFATI